MQLQSLLSDPSVVSAVLYAAAALFGHAAHAVKKWAEGASGGFVEWFVVNPRRTVAAFAGTIAAIAGVIATGALSGLALGPCIALGFFQGYSTDSAINRGK